MEHLYSESLRHHLLGISAERLGSRHQQHGAQAFAPAVEGVAYRLIEAGRHFRIGQGGKLFLNQLGILVNSKHMQSI